MQHVLFLSEIYREMSVSKVLLHTAVISNSLIQRNWFAAHVYNNDHSYPISNFVIIDPFFVHWNHEYLLKAQGKEKKQS